MNTKQLLELCKNEVQDDGLFELYSKLFLKIAESAHEAGREEGYNEGYNAGYAEAGEYYNL